MSGCGQLVTIIIITLLWSAKSYSGSGRLFQQVLVVEAAEDSDVPNDLIRGE